VRPYLKITNAKNPGRVAQVVKSLPRKNEALDSNHSTTKKIENDND
jgi:hypothetical protein